MKRLFGRQNKEKQNNCWKHLNMLRVIGLQMLKKKMTFFPYRYIIVLKQCL